MALEGTLKDFALPDIFQLIGLQKKTGVLYLRDERDEVTPYRWAERALSQTARYLQWYSRYGG